MSPAPALHRAASDRRLGSRGRTRRECRLDASGAAGGGSVLVGGGYQGKVAAVPNASAVTMDRGVVIAADAIGAGRGGDVVPLV
jgi:hypothetical protein